MLDDIAEDTRPPMTAIQNPNFVPVHENNRYVKNGVVDPYLSPWTAMWWIVSDRGDAILKNSLPFLLSPTIDEP